MSAHAEPARRTFAPGVSTRLRLFCLMAAFSLGADEGKRDLSDQAPLPAAEALKHLIVPEGFTVSLVAGEPEVVNPKAIAFDERGRMWVIQDVHYDDGGKRAIGQPATGPSAVLVFTDSDGDGSFDKREVFLELDEMPSGTLIVGQGAVIVGIGPHLVRFPLAPGGSTPAGEGRVLVTGWAAGRHEHNNGCEWGPDGWLYGGQGFVARSRCWIPATPVVWKPRLPPVVHQNNAPANALLGSCGVFRFTPDGTGFEWWAEGGSNIWGMDFDANGDLQCMATVSEGPYHWIQGGRNDRQDGAAKGHDPFTYRYQTSNLWELRIPKDQRTTPGSAASGGVTVPPGWQRFGIYRQMGGAYLFGDAWPETCRGRLAYTYGNGVALMNVASEGSGTYAWSSGTRLLESLSTKPERGRPAGPPRLGYQIFKAIQGPDQALYVLDWAENAGECHSGVFKRDGRIYRLAPKGLKPAPAFDLAAEDDGRLVRRNAEDWEWFSRRARIELACRAAAGRLAAGTVPALMEQFAKAASTPARLRALWALHACRATTATSLLPLFRHDDERVRAWAIQFACEGRQPSPPVAVELQRLASEDGSLVVRRYLASAAQRVPAEVARPLLLALIARAEDAGDRNLPLLYWYALAPQVGADAAFGAQALGATRIALVRELIARRLADPGPRPAPKK